MVRLLRRYYIVLILQQFFCFLIILSTSSWYLTLAADNLYEGNVCKPHTDSNGICKKLQHCMELLPAITAKQYPVICRFIGHEPVVCCPTQGNNVANQNNITATTNKVVPLKTTTNANRATTNSANKFQPVTTSTMATIVTKPGISASTTGSSANSVKDDQLVTAGSSFFFSTTSATETDWSSTAEHRTVTVATDPPEATIQFYETKSPLDGNVTSSKESKSERMCKVYSESVYVEVVHPAQLLGDEDLIEKKAICEILETLIVGGVAANPKEFPHMALIGYGSKIQTADWMCGGSLISEKYVLSAAHCSDTQYGPAKWVRLGDLNIESEQDDAKPDNFEIVRRIKHPKYIRPQLYNDIALFELDREISSFNEYIRPICLNPNTRVGVDKAIATGWGRLDNDGLRSETLMKVILPLVSGQACNASFQNNIGSRIPRGIDPTTMICAGKYEGGKDTCQGDSGGPLQKKHDEYRCMYTQIGVTSFGRKCAAPNSPGVYTRISNYVRWIEDIVWPD